MREPRPLAGARVPLFDRLVDEDPAAAGEPAPLRVLDREALLASVEKELSRLLNTRSPHPERLLGNEPACVLDYGVPDFSALGPASGLDRDGYAALLCRIIPRFEPRLREVKIHFLPVAGDPLRLRGVISGRLQLGMVREPVSFPLLLHTSTGTLTLEEGAAAGAAESGTE